MENPGREALTAPEFYPYQIEGSDQLHSMRYAILADEMGLGKTAQCIRAADLAGYMAILVVCPAIARLNWQEEFEMFSPYSRPSVVIESGKDNPISFGVSITSYDLATQEASRKKLEAIDWDLIILDEGHFLKGKLALRTKAVYGGAKIKDGARVKFPGLISKTKAMWFVSGTPAPNNYSELWPVLKAFGVTQLDAFRFTRRFCKGYDNGLGQFVITGGRNADELRKMLKPIMIRRLKKDVLMDLPPISYHHFKVKGADVDDATYFPEYYRAPELKQDLLRQKAALEAMWSRSVGDAKLKALEAMAGSVSEIRRYIGLAKAPPAIELIQSWLDSGLDKIVIFGWHRDVLMMLRDGLKQYRPALIFGGTPPDKRHKHIKRFQTDEKYRVIVGQIQAAGTAITLTNAHVVCIVEPSWVPGENAQAVMRVHRIGQENPVQVRFINMVRSIDDDIMRALKLKTQALTELFDK